MDIEITIKVVPFNLYQWLWILIHNTNLLVNLWQRSSEVWEIVNSLHHQIELQLNHKSLGEPLKKWLTSSQLYVHESPMVCSFLLSGHINVYYKNTYTKEKLPSHTCYKKFMLLETINITSDGPEYWNWQIWNYIFIDG